MQTAAYRQRTGLLRAAETFNIEDNQLVRRMAGGGETRWPLSGLRRATLIRRGLGGRSGRLVLQLSFARRRGLVLTSHSLVGVGRFDDQTLAFKAFCRGLLQIARGAAPNLLVERAGLMTASALWWAMAVLACGAVVVVGSAVAGGAAGLGLDLGARLVFLLLLAACALPWLSRGAAGVEAEDMLAD